MEQKYLELLTDDRETERVALLAILDSELKNAPPGTLEYKNIRGRDRWYCYEKGKERYLPRSEMDLVRALAQKDYDQKLYKLLKEQAAVFKIVKKKLPVVRPEDVYEEYPASWQQWIAPRLQSEQAFEQKWLAKLGKYASGEEFKSKSEELINLLYEKYELAHVYEPSLYLKGYGYIKPDFAVLHPKTHKTIYHEHFGRLGEDEYRGKMFAKLRDYHRNGFYEGVNLLVTMEDSTNALKRNDVEPLIKSFFLE